MHMVITTTELRKALADIEAAEKNGFMYCIAVVKSESTSSRLLSERKLTYSDMIERAHLTDPSLDWGRHQHVSKDNKFIDGKLVPIKEADKGVSAIKQFIRSEQEIVRNRESLGLCGRAEFSGHPIVGTLFESELQSLINKYSVENTLDMPDFILAEMICRMLEVMGPKIKNTLDWHGCKSPCHPKSPKVE